MASVTTRTSVPSTSSGTGTTSSEIGTTSSGTGTPAEPVEARAATSRFLGYLGRSLAIQLRDWSFLAFIIAMPSTIYLFFATIYGDQTAEGGASAAAVMMIAMATYGGLGAAMSAGNQITNERSTGWFRQLMLTALTPAQFIGAKVLVAVGIILPAIAVVFAAGATRGVRMPAQTWLGSGGLMLAALLPMVLLGLVIGLWLKPAAAAAATTLTMLALAMLGGLWFPLEMMPEAMQVVGRALPSYWAGRIASWPLMGGDFPLAGVGVIVAWTAALVGLGALGYRRAVRTSRR